MAEIVSAFPTSIAMNDSGVQRVAEAYVYAATDLTFATPLAITDLQGVPFTGGKLTTTTGQFPQFKAPAGVTQVLVKSGTQVTLLTDVAVFAGAAIESATAAAGSAGAADSSRAATVVAQTAAETAAAKAVAVGDTNDTIIEGRMKDPTSKTAQELKRTIGAGVAPGWLTTLPAFQGVRGNYTGRYTVVGTGADDRAAIQAMIDAATQPDGSYAFSELKRRGVTVKIPWGVYLLSAPDDGSPSIKVREGVTLDWSGSMVFADYPAQATGSWSAIIVYNAASINPPAFLAPSGRTPAPGAPGASNTAFLYDGIRFLANNNQTSSLKVIGSSEIRGFAGASIRSIASHILHVDGPLYLASEFGYIASSWPASNVYGYAHPADLVGKINDARWHTDLWITGAYYNSTRSGGFRGVVTGAPDNPHALDFVRRGGFQLYHSNGGWEYFANYALLATAGLMSFRDTFFENVGSNGNSMASLNTVDSVVIDNHRVNYEFPGSHPGVPAPGGGLVKPFVNSVWRFDSVQSVSHRRGRLRNVFNENMLLFSGDHPGAFDVDAPRVESGSHPLLAGPMVVPGGHVRSPNPQVVRTASKTLEYSDQARVVEMDAATALTVTVPLNSMTPFPLGTVIELFQRQAGGQVTVVGASGVTVVSPTGVAKTRAQYSTIRLRKRAADFWVLSGDLATS